LFVTPAIIAAAEARYGVPRELHVAYEITPAELAMVRASQRDGRAHDVTVFAFNGALDGGRIAGFAGGRSRRLAVIAKPSYPPGAFRVPGGALRPGEAMDVGAAREAHEETGLRVAIERYLLRIHARFTVGDDGIAWTTHVLSATTDDAEVNPRDTREISAARWSDLDELNGPIRAILVATGRPLFRYRTDLHLWAAEQLQAQER
jgi:8-oxo-dGTP pyrophosphatase MutT (NUDIX family)